MRKLPRKLWQGLRLEKVWNLKFGEIKNFIFKKAYSCEDLSLQSEFKEKKAELPKKAKKLDIDTLKVTVSRLKFR